LKSSGEPVQVWAQAGAPSVASGGVWTGLTFQTVLAGAGSSGWGRRSAQAAAMQTRKVATAIIATLKVRVRMTAMVA
jgi:hypothetical protein